MKDYFLKHSRKAMRFRALRFTFIKERYWTKNIISFMALVSKGFQNSLLFFKFFIQLTEISTLIKYSCLCVPRNPSGLLCIISYTNVVGKGVFLVLEKSLKQCKKSKKYIVNVQTVPYCGGVGVITKNHTVNMCIVHT